MIVTAAGAETAVERALARVAERRVTEIMGQRERLGEVLVKPQRPRQRSRDLGDLKSMGKPGAEMIALVKDEDLSLVRQPAKRGRVDDAIAVAAKGIAGRTRRLGIEPAAAHAGRACARGASDCRFNRHAGSPD